MIQPGSGPAAASGGALFGVATDLVPLLVGMPPTGTGPELAAVPGRAAATWVFTGGVFTGGVFTGGVLAGWLFAGWLFAGWLFAGWAWPCRGVPG